MMTTTPPNEIHVIVSSDNDDSRKESHNEGKNGLYSSPRIVTPQSRENRVVNDHDFFQSNSSLSSDKGTIFQLQCQLESMRKSFKMSDDSSDNESCCDNESDSEITITTFGTTTRIGEVSQIELNQLSVLREIHENMENDYGVIKKELIMREKEVKALVLRCATQEKKLKGLRATKVLEKEITQLSDALKMKEIEKGILSGKLRSVEEEKNQTFEDMEKFKAQKSKEVSDLQNTVKYLEREKASLDTEVTNLKTEVLSKDMQLKERHNEIISFANSRLGQEEKIEALRSHQQLLISNHDKAIKASSKTISNMKVEIERLKISSEKEASKFQESVDKKEEIIEQQKGDLANLQEDLTSRIDLHDKAVQQNHELEQNLEQKLSLVARLQAEAELHFQENEKLKAECSQLHNKIKDSDEKHLVAIRDKVKAEEVLKIRFEKIKAELLEKNEKILNYTELEKKNSILKDKIERQDNYLKKKLQQERQRKRSASTVSKIGSSKRRND